MAAAGPAFIDGDGWLAGDEVAVERILSPNHDARPAGVAPSLIVIHGISLPPGRFGGRAIDALFTNTLDLAVHPYFERLRGSRVSSHFLVRRDGALAQFVSSDLRAWHAGVSSFEGRERCNDFSIGIELEGDDSSPYEPAQYDTLVIVVDALTRRYAIDSVAGHDDIAPGRKTDPGPGFDWALFLASTARALRRSGA